MINTEAKTFVYSKVWGPRCGWLKKILLLKISLFFFSGLNHKNYKTNHVTEGTYWTGHSVHYIIPQFKANLFVLCSRKYFIVSFHKLVHLNGCSVVQCTIFIGPKKLEIVGSNFRLIIDLWTTSAIRTHSLRWYS